MSLLFQTFSKFAIKLWTEFADFFELLVVENAPIGEVISTFFPGFDNLQNILEWLLPYNAFEFLFLSLGLWLSFVVIKFIIDLVL